MRCKVREMFEVHSIESTLGGGKLACCSEWSRFRGHIQPGTAFRVARQLNMVMSPARLETKNVCVGEGQQQFTRQQIRVLFQKPLLATILTFSLYFVLPLEG
jgi:hypothetical protein